MKKILAVILILYITVFLVACNDSTNTPPETGSETEPSSSKIPSESESEVESDTQDNRERPSDYNEAIALYTENELVLDDISSSPLKNVNLLEAWIENYQQGIPGEVPVVLYTEGGPTLFILESNGSATYTIMEYRNVGHDRPQPLTIYESSCVVERKYDYVFGSDFSSDIMRNAIVFHKTAAPEMIDLDWDPQSNIPFDGGIPFEEAQERAIEVDGRLFAHLSVIPNYYGGGVYLRQNIIDQATDFEWKERHYKVTGAIEAGGQTCYILYGNSDLEALERGESDGSVRVVSIDGNLVFISNEAHGGWIFVDDAEQQVITQNIN